MNDIDKREVVALLNRILESELAGVVRYTHYSLLVFAIIAFLSCHGCENKPTNLLRTLNKPVS
jgi:hypothetical protein